ncbi:hypothetical protein M405DRAFT_817088 [Rhizopogon salebrosus TDB-379]|nr:hypothetical protein M405DRAFT_817088 [Rhizopogon salebrosus TDB-379]
MTYSNEVSSDDHLHHPKILGCSNILTCLLGMRKRNLYYVSQITRHVCVQNESFEVHKDKSRTES